MPRIRSIHPTFWEDEDVALLTRDARLLYIATWTAADDEGLLRWTTSYLKAMAFMYDDDITESAVADAMDELTHGGFVVPYHGGRTDISLGWVPRFLRYQHPNRPQRSKLPPPSIHNDRIKSAYGERDWWRCYLCVYPIPDDSVQFTSRMAIATLQVSLDHVRPKSKGGSDFPSNIKATHASCNMAKGPRDAGAVEVSPRVRQNIREYLQEMGLIESFTPGEGKGDGVGVGGENTPRARTSDLNGTLVPTERGVCVSPHQANFKSWWTRYPETRRVRQPDARGAWGAVNADSEYPEVVAGLDRWVAYWAGTDIEPRYIPNPATWLRNRQWRDIPPPIRSAMAKQDVATRRLIERVLGGEQ